MGKKMGNRKCKRLDRLAVQVINKTRVTVEPKNRAEKRRLRHLIRKARLEEENGPTDPA